MKTALVVPGDLGVDAMHGEVHLGEAVSGVVALLAVDGDFAFRQFLRLVGAARVLSDKLYRLNEHAARAAARIVDAALVRLQHVNEGAHD